ncbi:hypothetical protein O5623_06675 [Escherichia coli]|nr:hypothetical protein [Escherichia coli]
MIHDAGHAVFNAGNTYSGKKLVNDGLLTLRLIRQMGVTGMGSSKVTIASTGTLDILASTNSAGDFTLTNALKGDGLMRECSCHPPTRCLALPMQQGLSSPVLLN